ncbi:hypothetical protein GQ457_18G014140 [Hibiscus cannabinus]
MVNNLEKSSNTHEVKVLDSFCELCGSNHDFFECTQNPKSSFYQCRGKKFCSPYIKKTKEFMDRTEMRMQNQEDALKSLENQVAQISKGATHEHCKAITTRSGTKLSEIKKDKHEENIVDNTDAATAPNASAPIGIVLVAVDPDQAIPQEVDEADSEAI